jgi:predicted TIM-barrel fold metal-dependent hydrolase
MRRGSWDIKARLADMDLDGVYASVCFPSFLAGFGGGRIQTATADPELALACLKAWNDWVYEEWCAEDRRRMIPLGITWLHDPAVGAAEIRRNAARGFRALAFPENPEPYGWPTIHSTHWDPIFEACQETGTVLCLHVGSAGTMPASFGNSPMDVPATLFGTYAGTYTVEWLFSLVALRFPNIKICISEGGIGWIVGLRDKLDHNSRYDDMLGTWKEIEIRPSELLKRNFWFCALDDPTSWLVRERIGVDNICVESDYPHGDGSWPDTQALLKRQLVPLSAEEVAMVTWKNAIELFNFEIPASVVADPESY